MIDLRPQGAQPGSGGSDELFCAEVHRLSLWPFSLTFIERRSRLGAFALWRLLQEFPAPAYVVQFWVEGRPGPYESAAA